MTTDELVAIATPLSWDALVDSGRIDPKVGACVAATTVLVKSLAYFGIQAEPLVVAVHAFNEAMVARIKRGDAPGFDMDHETEFAKHGSWGVGIAFETPPPPKSFGGHCVAFIEHRLIADPSASQMSRPKRNMTIEPYVCELPPAGKNATWDHQRSLFFKDSTHRPMAERRLSFSLPGGVDVVYEPHPECKRWRTSPDYLHFDDRYRPVAGRVIRAMRNLNRLTEQRALRLVLAMGGRSADLLRLHNTRLSTPRHEWPVVTLSEHESTLLSALQATWLDGACGAYRFARSEAGWNLRASLAKQQT